jgi:hypothetical protein
LVRQAFLRTGAIRNYARRKEIAGVERCIPEKFNGAAVNLVASRFSNYINDALVAVFGVEIVRENAELGDRIEIGNDGSAAIHEFFDIPAVHYEAVGVFALPTDGLGCPDSGCRKAQSPPLRRP